MRFHLIFYSIYNSLILCLCDTAHSNVKSSQIDSVLNYEIANAQAQQTGKDLFVTFDCEPIALLEALSQGKLPAMNTHGQFEVRVPG